MVVSDNKLHIWSG